MDSSQGIVPVAVSLATTVTNRVTSSELLEPLPERPGGASLGRLSRRRQGASRPAPGSGHRVSTVINLGFEM